MIEPYRIYYQESIKRSFTNNGNNPNTLEDGSPKQSRKKKETNTNAPHDIISVSLKTPPPTPSPPSSMTASQRRNIVKSLNRKPSMTKRLEKNPRIPKTKAVKAGQHQRQHSSQQIYGPHGRRHYKEKRPSSYTSIAKSATRSRKTPASSNSFRLSYNTLKNLNSTTMTLTPPFDKDILDTFCFHWPAMHCYVLVRILPQSIAILPIRTRLAFLYFCHAPRPRQPSLQDLHHQQINGRRIQSMFKSWKHTLAFNDSSSSSTSSDDDDENDSKIDNHNTKDSQLDLDQPASNKKHQNQQQMELATKDNSTHADYHYHQQQQQKHHSQTEHHPHHAYPQRHQQLESQHHHRHHHHQTHRHHHHHHSKPTTHRHTSSKDSLSKHRRQHSAMSNNSTEEGDADQYSKEGKAVTLSDVLKDHRTDDVCWIHAPCKILKSSTVDGNTTINNFVTLQSRRTTLELKARCYSEKKMFMNLFKLNRLMHNVSKQPDGQSKQQKQSRHITETELIKGLETQNDKLQSKISQLHDQMEKWQQDILHYEEQCGVMDDKLDITMAAVQHHKEQHVEYEELTDTLVGTRQELKSHMDDFHKTHQRILHQHAGNTGSFSWVIEKSFQRLQHFQNRHSTQSGSPMVYILPVSVVIALVVAVYIGYYHT